MRMRFLTFRSKADISCVLRQGPSSLLIGYKTERIQPINKLERPCRTTHEISALRLVYGGRKLMPYAVIYKN